jgi:ribosome maturation factor RimP
VEVSSPGLDRKLTTADDFRRVVGKKVRFLIERPGEKIRDIVGTVTAVEHERVSAALDTQQITLNIGEILQAKLEIRW